MNILGRGLVVVAGWTTENTDSCRVVTLSTRRVVLPYDDDERIEWKSVYSLELSKNG
jgi:hypothetical protein